MRKTIITAITVLYFLFANGQAVTTWSVGNITWDCNEAQICYQIMVQSTLDNTQLSQVTLRFLYDPTLIDGLSTANAENSYVVTIDSLASPPAGDEFGFQSDLARFARLSIAPNVADYLDIMNGVPTHVYDMCFTIVPVPIPESPEQFCAALIFDNNHILTDEDLGYFVGDEGIQTQYVVNSMGTVIAADDEAIQFLWMGDPSFDGMLNTSGEIVGSVATTGCILIDCSLVAVDLLDFHAYRKDNAVQLQWSTTYELQNDYFEVQRRDVTEDFVTIGRVDGRGEGSGVWNYTFVDIKPIRGVNYYRLRQVDNDGKYTYSQVRSVVFDVTQGTTVRIAPNPANDLLTLSISSSVDEEVSFRVSLRNMNGQVLRVIELNVRGQLSKEVDISALAPGLYMIEVRGQTGIIHTGKIIKQDP